MAMVFSVYRSISAAVLPRRALPATTYSRRPEYSAIDFYRITAKVQLAIYNSIILAWREKVSRT